MLKNGMNFDESQIISILRDLDYNDNGTVEFEEISQYFKLERIAS